MLYYHLRVGGLSNIAHKPMKNPFKPHLLSCFSCVFGFVSSLLIHRTTVVLSCHLIMWMHFRCQVFIVVKGIPSSMTVHGFFRLNPYAMVLKTNGPRAAEDTNPGT